MGEYELTRASYGETGAASRRFLVRSGEERLGVVVRTTDGDEMDTSRRDEHGGYRCHVLESVRPAVDTFDVRSFREPVAA